MSSHVVRRFVIPSALSLSLLLTGSVSAHAAAPPGEQPLGPPALVPLRGLHELGYSDDEIEAAVAGSPYVSIEEEPGAETGRHARGVTFGKYIYVRVSQAQAKAIAGSSAVAAVGIRGLATGGVGGVVAATFYTYVASMNDSALSKCRRWEFRLTYPALGPSRVVSARCI